MNLHSPFRPFSAGLTIVVASAVAFASSLAAQSGGWSPHDDLPGFGIGGRVFALGTFQNELVAGTYRNVHKDGNDLHHVAHFDGERWLPFGTGVDGRVRTVCEFQGDLYVGGAFVQAGSGPAANVARWDGARWHPVGAGFDGEVWSLVEHRGELYASGQFTQSGSRSVSRVARWDGAQWQPVGGGVTWSLGMYAAIYTMVSDGALLYAGGEFDRAGNVAASHVAAWDGTNWRALGGGMNNFGWGTVWALAMYRNQLYAGGYFGLAGTLPVERIAAWNGSTWSAVDGGVRHPTSDCAVHALVVHGTDLYVGGDFVVAGQANVDRIARFDGTRFHAIGGVDLAEFQPPTVIALASWNGRVWVGGEFHVAGGPQPRTQAVYHVASYDGNRWAAVGRGLGLGSGGAKILTRWRGRVVVGGSFATAGGRHATQLAAFDGDDWQPLGTFDGIVTGALEHQGDLLVAGQFSLGNGVARFDGSQWFTFGNGPSLHRAFAIAVYQGTIHVGTVGNARRWNGTAWEDFGIATTGAINALHVHGGLLYLGGDTPFHPNAPNLFAWDGTTMRVVGGGTDGSVDAFASFAGDLVLGGAFTHAGGVPARCIARWDGTRFTTFGTGVRGARVAAITTFQNQLVIGGDFSRFQGENADYLARWTANGWQPLPGGEPDGYVAALLADDARGELHVGGGFSRTGAFRADNYGLWQAAPAWTAVGGALGSPRRAPILWGEGSLLAAATTRLIVSSADERAPLALVLGARRLDVPLLGGTLVPEPNVVLPAFTDGIGRFALEFPWPPNLPSVPLWWQGWCLDAAAPQGATATNGVQMVTR